MQNCSDLSKCKCEPCQGGIPPMTEEEAKAHLKLISGWELVDNATAIQKRFKFSNFSLTMKFANLIADLAEIEGHHPILTIGWGFCIVRFKTSKIKGLHLNDFIMASKVDQIFSSNFECKG